MYWTPAKMLLLADVDQYSFANADINWEFETTKGIAYFTL